MHVLTGKSEIERCCVIKSSGSTLSPSALLTLLSSIKASKAIPEVLKLQLLSVSSVSAPLSVDLDSLFSRLVAEKKISRNTSFFSNSFKPKMLKFLQVMRSLNDLKAYMKTQATQCYDEANPDHERMLVKLWCVLRPEVRLSNRISKDWQEIGFQGTNPATDFRGMGILGLQNLLMFVESYPAQARAVFKASSAGVWYPFAIAGINFTNDMLTLMRAGALDRFLLEQGLVQDSLNCFYATFFWRFHLAWQSACPTNVMAFASVHQALVKAITHELAIGSFDVLNKPANNNNNNNNNSNNDDNNNI